MPHHNIDCPSGSTIVSRRDRAFTACLALNILNSEDTWMKKAFRELSLQCTAVVAVIGKRSPVRHHSTWWSSEIQAPGNLMKQERPQVKSLQLLLNTSSLNSWPIWRPHNYTGINVELLYGLVCHDSLALLGNIDHCARLHYWLLWSCQDLATPAMYH